MEGDGANFSLGPKSNLAVSRTFDRTHPSDSGALLRNGLAGRGRWNLWKRAAVRPPRPETSTPQHRGAAIQESRAGPGHGASGATHERASRAMRMARRGPKPVSDYGSGSR